MDAVKVIISNDQKAVKVPTGIRMLIRRCCHAVLQLEGFKGSAEVSVRFVDNEQIRELNKQYRNIDKETDVLSFPMADYEKEGDFSFLEEAQDCFHPESGELLLGDIVISADKVLQQAESYGHSPLREYAFLIVHSLLHLVGYDHMEAEEAAAMEKKQAEILDSMGITR